MDAATAVNAEIRLYDRLFSEENPDDADGGFLTCLNENSLSTITNAKLEASLTNSQKDDVYQFERVGYFCADNVDHVAGEKLVFNRTVALKDSWK